MVLFFIIFAVLSVLFMAVGYIMKKILRNVRLIVALAFRQDYMFEDGDFDGIEFSDYDLIHNAELDMDDVDRN